MREICTMLTLREQYANTQEEGREIVPDTGTYVIILS